MPTSKTKSAKQAPAFDEDVAMEQIKSFEDACFHLGLDPIHVPEVSMLPQKHRGALIAHYKLIIIAAALNQGWEPNWNDSNEWKYYPWFEIEASKEKPSGFGFSGTDCVLWLTTTLVGSRLCFRTSNLARYAGKQFSELYKEYFLIQK